VLSLNIVRIAQTESNRVKGKLTSTVMNILKDMVMKMFERREMAIQHFGFN